LLGKRMHLLHPLHHSEFLTTATRWQELPVDGAPEIAFAGRSNAGKSSVINALAQHSNLAHASRTPGRTRHINFFRTPSGALLADLPGYGYAKVARSIQRSWQSFVARYLAEREPLVGLVLVMDARHPLTALDRKLLDWFLPTGRPVLVLLTKADKLTSSERRRTLQDTGRDLARDYRGVDLDARLFSATERIGFTAAEEAIAAWLPA
jgi:GTP-binding protein